MLLSLEINNHKIISDIDARLQDLESNLDKTSDSFRNVGQADLSLLWAIKCIQQF